MENCIHFWAERCRKYSLFQIKLQIKVFRRRISDKKGHEGICLSPPGVKLGGSKDDMVEILNCTETEKYVHFFQPYHLLRPLAPLRGEIDIWTRSLFCKLPFKTFFGIMRIFGSDQPKNEGKFSISVQFNISTISSFELPSSTPGGDRHTPTCTFLYKIRCVKTFISGSFWNNAYFWPHLAQKWVQFSISVQKLYHPSSQLAGKWRLSLPV